MSLPSNGITQDVIREMMPPCDLNHDLLVGMVTALPPPPPDAPPSWRQARIARLVQEIAIFMPADAGQARLAAQIVVVREAADDTFARSHAPGLTVEQVGRLRRTAADLTRTAATLERALARRQAKPAPFFGTVLAEGVDGDAPGGRGDPTDGPVPPGMAGTSPAMTVGESDDGSAATIGESGDGLAAAERESDDGSAATEGESGDSPAMTVGRQAPVGRGRDAGSIPGSVVTRLDQGPGWTLDVVRPEMGGKAGLGAAPGSVA